MIKIPERILTEEEKDSLRKYIEKNGGEIVDPDFEQLEKYLEMNPPNTVYLDN